MHFDFRQYFKFGKQIIYIMKRFVLLTINLFGAKQIDLHHSASIYIDDKLAMITQSTAGPICSWYSVSGTYVWQLLVLF